MTNKEMDRAVELIGAMTPEERLEVFERLKLCTHCMRETCGGWCDYPGTPVD